MSITEFLYKEELSKEEIVYLLGLEDELEIKTLYNYADKIREQYIGNEVHLRGIIEFSNYCKQDCLYCGLRESNHQLERYRMSLNEIVETARNIYSLGIRTIVLQSGEDDGCSTEYITSIIHKIKSNFDVAITLSLGEREFSEYDEWFAAGADRYLLKHETANNKLYSTYHQGQNLSDRIAHLEYLKSIGFQIGSGNMVGMPHQTLEDVADDILLCKKLDVDMASFSPFVSSPSTPYKNKPNCNVDLLLRCMAVGRIVLKNSHIPATTALATLDEEGREKGLKVGANVIMPNFTPTPYRHKYLIYPDKKCLNDNPNNCPSCLTFMVEAMGRRLSTSKGHSLKQNQK